MSETKANLNSVTAALASLEEAIRASADSLEGSKRANGEQEGDAIKSISEVLEALPQGSRETVLDFVQNRYVDDAPQRSTIRLHSRGMLVDMQRLQVLKDIQAITAPFHALVNCLLPFKKVVTTMDNEVSAATAADKRWVGTAALAAALSPDELTLQHLIDLVKAGDAADNALKQLDAKPAP